jgi:hypothetical protein
VARSIHAPRAAIPRTGLRAAKSQKRFPGSLGNPTGAFVRFRKANAAILHPIANGAMLARHLAHGKGTMGNLTIVKLKAKWEALRCSTFDWWKQAAPEHGEQRAEPRFDAEEDASVKVLGQSDGKAVAARIVSRSRKGMRLTTPFIFPCQLVEVRLNAGTVAGEVRYCRLCADGYQLGIRLHATRFVGS